MMLAAIWSTQLLLCLVPPLFLVWPVPWLLDFQRLLKWRPLHLPLGRRCRQSGLTLSRLQGLPAWASPLLATPQTRLQPLRLPQLFLPLCRRLPTQAQRRARANLLLVVMWRWDSLAPLLPLHNCRTTSPGPMIRRLEFLPIRAPTLVRTPPSMERRPVAAS